MGVTRECRGGRFWGIVLVGRHTVPVKQEEQILEIRCTASHLESAAVHQ